ncbi:MAG: putative delta-60 repeat protein [Verrucomicrobiales bacterium]|jgi:uncharacterized delta-60 repeat protein
MPFRLLARTTAGILMIGGTATLSAQATFTELPALSGSSNSQARFYSLSSDASTVVGINWSSRAEAISWNAVGGPIRLGSLDALHYYSQAEAISADGSVIVGQSRQSDGSIIPAYWQGGSIHALAVPGSSSGFAMDCSADGATIVGQAIFDGNYRAFKWSSLTGFTDLGDFPGGYDYSYARAISDDGTVVTGYSSGYEPGGSYSYQGFRWTETGGMQALGQLPSSRSGVIPLDIAGDGSTIVGYGRTEDNRIEAFHWTEETGIVPLGYLDETYRHSMAFACSENGNVTVGRTIKDSAVVATVWDAEHGLRELAEVLINEGVDLTGWQLIFAEDVSADGSTILGHGRNPSGRYVNWLATIAPPAPTPVMNVPGSAVVEENTGFFDLVVTLESVATGDVTADVTVTPITAAAGVDFIPPAASVTIPAGALQAPLTIGIVGDYLYEDDELFSVSISNPVGALIGSETCLVTITNDDPEPPNPENVLFPGGFDKAFGENGVSIAEKTYPSLDIVSDLVIDRTGRTILVGTSSTGKSNQGYALRLLASGATDPTFGEAGLARLWSRAAFSNDYVHAVTIQDDGSILVCGRGQPSSSSTNKLTVTRLLPDGSRDLSFGTDGSFVYQGSPFGTGEGRDIVVGDDGNIHILGTEFISNVFSTILIALDPTGSPLTSFSGDGVHPLYTSDAQTVSGFTFILDPEGRFLIGGALDNDFGVARINRDGSTDTTFGTLGFVRMSFSPETDYVRALAIDTGGRIYGAGPYDPITGSQRRFRAGIFRLLPDGSPDPDFHVDGRAHPYLGTSNEEIPTTAVLLPSGRLLVACSTVSGFGVIRMQLDGNLDPTFGEGDGIALIGPSSVSAKAMHVGASGDILVAGMAANDIVLGHLSSIGEVVSEWGTDGVVTKDLAGRVFDSEWLGLGQDSQGRLLAVGSPATNYYSGSYYNEALIGRFLADGTLDRDFGENGFVTYSQKGQHVRANDVATDGADNVFVIGTESSRALLFVHKYDSNGNLDMGFAGDGSQWLRPATGTYQEVFATPADGGSLLVASSAFIGGIQQVTLSKITSAGIIDTSFGSSGHVITSFASHHVLKALHRAEDGTIFLCGHADEGGTYKPFIARYGSDGTPDPGFGTDGFIQLNQFAGNYTTEGLLITAEGAIRIAGSVASYPGGQGLPQAFLLGLDADGLPESGFGELGLSVPPLLFRGEALSGTFGVAGAVAMADGRIVLGGYDYPRGSDGDVFLLRFDATGVLDTGFGLDGKAVLDLETGTDWNGWNDRIYAMLAIDGDRLVCAGAAGGSEFHKPALVTMSLADLSFLDHMILSGLSGAAAAPTADPNQDGIPNMLSVAFGIDPLTGEGRELRYPGSVLSEDGTEGELRFTVQVSPPSDLTYIVRQSCDLSEWIEIARRVGPGPWTGTGTVETLSESNGLREVLVVGSGTDPCGYFRVEVMLKE